MARYAYSTAYEPPAAVLPLAVRRPRDASVVLVAALVDTGADVTVLPADLAAQLELPHVGRVVVTGFDGLRRILPLCAASVRIARFDSIVEAACHGTVAVVGRDLLNRFMLCLDGPRRLFDVRTR